MFDKPAKSRVYYSRHRRQRVKENRHQNLFPYFLNGRNELIATKQGFLFLHFFKISIFDEQKKINFQIDFTLV